MSHRGRRCENNIPNTTLLIVSEFMRSEQERYVTESTVAGCERRRERRRPRACACLGVWSTAWPKIPTNSKSLLAARTLPSDFVMPTPISGHLAMARRAMQLYSTINFLK